MNHSMKFATRSRTLALSCMFALALTSCGEKKPPLEAQPISGAVDWLRYVGHYPWSADVEQPYGMPFLQVGQVKDAIAQILPASVLEEIGEMTVETPITQSADGYLLVHICQPHNCPHAFELIVDTRNLDVTGIIYRPGDSLDDEMDVTCYSLTVNSLGKFPKALRDSLSLAQIATVDKTLDVSKFPCRSKQI